MMMWPGCVSVIDLPIELIVEILQTVDANDIVNISRVCRALYEICTTFDWCQLYTPTNIQSIATQIRFKNISFRRCKINLRDLVMIQSVETIFLHDFETNCEESTREIFQHLFNIGCKNIMFLLMIDVRDIYKYLSHRINYYYYNRSIQIDRENSDILEYLNHNNTCYTKYCEKTRCKILHDYSEIKEFIVQQTWTPTSLTVVVSPIIINYAHRAIDDDTYVVTPRQFIFIRENILPTIDRDEIPIPNQRENIETPIPIQSENNESINCDKKYTSRYEKSVLRRETHYKMRQKYKQTNLSRRQKMKGYKMH